MTVQTPATTPLLQREGSWLAKSMKANPGDTHHLPILAEAEKRFYGAMGLEEFYEKLIKFIDNKIEPVQGEPLSLDQLRKVDTFTRDYFIGKLPEVETWIVRGFVLGKLLETRERTAPPHPKIDLDKLPAKVREAAKEYKLTLRETRAIEWAESYGAKNLSNATNDTINRVQNVLFDNVKQHLGPRSLRKALEAEFMEDEFEINRNWRRVANTETNAAYNQGYLAQIPPGEWVMGFSNPDACYHCKRLIDGKVYQVIDVAGKNMSYDDSKNPEALQWLWENTVWLGKDNFGRSGAEQKRTPTGLVDREHHEKYMPTLPLHPHEHCRWVRISPQTQYVNSKGEMRMRVMDEEAWKAWYSASIKPIEGKLGMMLKEAT